MAQAMRDVFTDTHNVAEGAGAFTATMQERDALKGRVIGATLSGGHVDAVVLARVLGAPADCCALYIGKQTQLSTVGTTCRRMPAPWTTPVRLRQRQLR